MGYLYRYTDLNDGIIKYVGIVYSEKRSLTKRIKEHEKDFWYGLGNWKIEYVENIQTRMDAEILEAYYINLYKSDKWYNRAKASWGNCTLFNENMFSNIRWQDISCYYQNISKQKIEINKIKDKKNVKKTKDIVNIFFYQFIDYIAPYWKKKGIIKFNERQVFYFFENVNIQNFFNRTLTREDKYHIFGELAISCISLRCDFEESFETVRLTSSITIHSNIISIQLLNSNEVNTELMEIYTKLLDGDKFTNDFRNKNTIYMLSNLYSKNMIAQNIIKKYNEENYL